MFVGFHVVFVSFISNCCSRPLIAAAVCAMHIVSSAYTASSKSVPAIRCLAVRMLSFTCISWNIIVMTVMNKYGERGASLSDSWHLCFRPWLFPVHAPLELGFAVSCKSFGAFSGASSFVSRRPETFRGLFCRRLFTNQAIQTMCYFALVPLCRPFSWRIGVLLLFPLWPEIRIVCFGGTCQFYMLFCFVWSTLSFCRKCWVGRWGSIVRYVFLVTFLVYQYCSCFQQFFRQTPLSPPFVSFSSEVFPVDAAQFI